MPCRLNFHELAVLVVIAGKHEEDLLYTVLGDPFAWDTDTSGATCTADRERPTLRKLLHPDTSVIQEFDSKMWGFLHGWRGAPDRRPWMILDVLRADLDDQSFKKWSRGVILRMDASSQRRISSKFEDWPYPLYMACDPATPKAKTEAVMQRVLDEDRAGETQAEYPRGSKVKRRNMLKIIIHGKLFENS